MPTGRLAGMLLALALVTTSLPATASMLSVSRADVFAADPSIVNGDQDSTGTVGGVPWSFDYVQASNAQYDGTTVFTPMSATTLFSATTANVFGEYDFGFGAVNPYFTHGAAPGTVIGTRLLATSAGQASTTIGGQLTPWTATTVAGSTIDINWALVEYDLALDTLTTLDSGAIRGTSTGSGNATMTLTGDLAVQGSASLQGGDWVGLFFEKTASSAVLVGSHFNINDAAVTYTIPVSVPAPSPLVLLGVALFAALARDLRQRG